MAAHSSRQRRPTRPSGERNWLKELDTTARNLPAGSNWFEHPELAFQRCPLFIVTRHPMLVRLFPKEVIDRELTRGESQISEHPGARTVLDGLNVDQRRELAALFLDTITALENHNAYKHLAGRAHKLADEAPRRIRSLHKKISKARRALEALRDYAKGLDQALFIRSVPTVVEACLKKLSALTLDATPELFGSVKGEYPALEDPVELSMVQLYWFFREGCRLAGREAEVRVALLRNIFWTKHGVSEVPFRSQYRTGESRGCNAVHSAVLRFQPSTFRQTTH
jgi:hypothetical protein